MGPKAKVFWQGLLDAVCKYMEEWEPPPDHQHERDLHLSLESFLRQRMPDAYIEREYRHAGTTADLYVRWEVPFGGEVFIEVKRHLARKSECDRLVGQLDGLNPDKHQVIALLVGESRPELAKRVRDKYGDTLHLLNKFRFIEKA